MGEDINKIQLIPFSIYQGLTLPIRSMIYDNKFNLSALLLLQEMYPYYMYSNQIGEELDSL